MEFKILDGKDYYDDAIVKLKKQFDDLQLKNIELSTELRNSKKFELLKKIEEIRESSLEELYARQWGLKLQIADLEATHFEALGEFKSVEEAQEACDREMEEILKEQEEEENELNVQTDVYNRHIRTLLRG